MWFDSWTDLVRIAAVGAAAYLFLVTVLRVSGKRTLAKLNAFDLVVTVAFGSTLSAILLDTTVSWSEGAVALLWLAVLQFFAATLSSRSTTARKVLTADPTLLLMRGTPIDHALKDQRVSAEELRQAVRASGVGDLAKVAAVVLETDGTMSVITDGRLGDGSALVGITES